MIEYIQTIGVVGLGRMGTAIAHNILKSGFKLVVYNRTPNNTRSLVDASATCPSTPSTSNNPPPSNNPSPPGISNNGAGEDGSGSSGSGGSSTPPQPTTVN